MEHNLPFSQSCYPLSGVGQFGCEGGSGLPGDGGGINISKCVLSWYGGWWRIRDRDLVGGRF